jgi:phytanoyl-CoA hydroxylase
MAFCAEEWRMVDVAAALEHLARHGWARLGNVADDATLSVLRQRADDVMLGRVTYPGLFFQADSPSGDYEDLEYARGWQGPSLAYRKVEKMELDPHFRAWMENPLFEQVAHAALGPAVSLFRAVLWTKHAGGGTELPWHQDGGLFWGVDKDPTLQVWTALDDAPLEAGCVHVIPGSHLAGLTTPNGGVVPPNFLARVDLEKESVALPAQAGEVILLHNHTWHRSGRNSTGKPRRAFSVCFMDAATRCLRTRRKPRTFMRVFEKS